LTGATLGVWRPTEHLDAWTTPACIPSVKHDKLLYRLDHASFALLGLETPCVAFHCQELLLIVNQHPPGLYASSRASTHIIATLTAIA